MGTETLTSLAMLKVHIDQGRDYLDYLRPFIQQVLHTHRPDPVREGTICELLNSDFGLVIPERAVQLMLKRLARKLPLEREHGVYRIVGDVPNPGIEAEKASAERAISSVVMGLVEFSKDTARPLSNEAEAVEALCSFLSEFDIPCLRSYLRGTVIPIVRGKDTKVTRLVGQYVLHLQDSMPERFADFMVMAQGHMLANGLLCPDLQNAPKTYRGVAFYLDTPLLVRLLGLEGAPRAASARNLMEMVSNLGGDLRVFSHTREELDNVICGAAEHIGRRDGRGAIVLEANRAGTTKSDLLLIAAQLDARLSDFGIKTLDTPPHVRRFEIDEGAFTQVLDDDVGYYNHRARDYDVDSVRSIYTLRSGAEPKALENCKAVLVTPNTAFSKAAYEFGNKHEEASGVSTVITDFSLANMAWLKAPLARPDLPTAEILAYSYAAMQPSAGFLDSFLEETEKLEKLGLITPRDHQLLRSSSQVQDELMHMTLGDESALTDESIMQTLQRVSDEIRNEEAAKVSSERQVAREARRALEAALKERQNLQFRLFWKCKRRAERVAGFCVLMGELFVVLGFVAGLGLRVPVPFVGWTLTVGSAVLFLVSIVSLRSGHHLRSLGQKLESKVLTWLLRREEAATGIDLSGPHEFPNRDDV